MSWSFSLSLIVLLIPVARNLEYEYLWFIALIAALITPWLAIILSRYPMHKLSVWELVIGYPLLILPIPGLLFASGLCPCSFRTFLFWFILQVYPAWLIGLGSAAIVQTLSIRYQGRLKPALLLAGWQFLFLAIAASILWFYPQKRLSYFLLGFVHGPIYDSWLPIDGGIIFSRMNHGLLGLGILLICQRIIHKKRILSSALAITCLALLGMVSTWFLPTTGHGLSALNRLLPQTKQHEFFTLHYINATQDPQYDTAIHSLFQETLFHVTELRDLLGDDAPHVQVFVYPDQDLKKLWFGGGGTDVTDVVTPSIHIMTWQGPHPTLRHELVHALSSHMAFYGLGFHPNMAITEGLAVALAPIRRSRSLDEAAAAMIHQNRLPALSNLMSPMFWTQSGARAYTAAGSLLQFLIRSYGIETVKDIYAGRSLNSLDEKNWLEILEEWQSDLLQRYPLRRDLETEALYRYQGVLQDRCPQTKATYQQSSTDYWTRIRQISGWQASRDYWPWRKQLEGNDIEVLVRYYRSIAHKAISSYDYLTIDQIYQSITQQLQWPPASLEDVELKLLASDLLHFRQDWKGQELLKDILDLITEELVGPALTRQIWSRWLIQTSYMEDDVKKQWLNYLAGWQSIPNTSHQNDQTPWIVSYLQNFRWQGEDAENLLNQTLPKNITESLPGSFFEMWHLNIAYRLMQKDRWILAEQAFLKSLRFSQEGGKEKTQELIRYMQFLQNNPL